MDTWLTQILSSANGRHFREDELLRILMYGQSMPARLHACKEVLEQKDYLQRQLLKTHVDIVGHSAFATDLVEAMLPIAQAMLLDDLSVLETKLSDRLHTLIVLMDMGTNAIEVVVNFLENTLKARVSQATVELLSPYFAWTREHIVVDASAEHAVLV